MLRDRLPEWFSLNGITCAEQANAALPNFIAEYNVKFAVKPESDESVFVRKDGKDDIDTLPAVRHERSAGNYGRFSFQNFTFQMVADRPPAKKEIPFLFREKTGFKVYYDKRYYPMELRRLSNSRKAAHLPEATKLLLQRACPKTNYFT
jgi:hypothetical protein